MAEIYTLTCDDAKIRSENIEGVSYEVSIAITKESGFSGLVKIFFTCKNPTIRTFVEYHGKQVDSVKINGESSEIIWKNSQIDLPNLKQGQNIVEIEYQNNYSNDGLGLHHYKDPEDQECYVYSQCEPFAANRILPCFDQPDLKATFNLSIVAPRSWKVISNEKCLSKIPIPTVPGVISEPYSLHIFKQSPKMSTYLFAVCAGPYEEIRLDNNEVNIELGLFCRRALRQYLDSEKYFRWTIEGFKFYNEFFGYKYPFSKYDQLFVPEFKFGAMENIGCVTFRDQFLFKDPPSNLMLSRVCEVVLHEMAHMWFGDLVTMKWWDDLWLNESFATFMSFVAKEDKLLAEHPTVWIEFLGKKGWGYATDQLPTTHPISTHVENTSQTESNFDGISYSKGSSVLKQLYFLVGKEVFSQSLKIYVNKYQFLNAEFNDLIEIIAEQARIHGNPIDINHWAQIWVKTAGLNELEPIIERDNEGKIIKFVIKQSAALPEFPTLRDHKIIVELFDSSMNSIQKSTITVLPQEETILDQFNGLPVACAILNVEDWGYCKIRIDEQSFNTLKLHLSKIPQPLTRQLVYRALWDMVRDIKMSGIEFIEFVLAQVPLEKDSEIASFVLDYANAASSFIPISPEKDNLMHDLLELTLSKLSQASSSQESITYKNKASGFIYRKDDVERAIQWVINNDTGIPNLKLGKNDRWNIIQKYSELTYEADAIVKEECKKDPSDTGHIAALYCESAYPVFELKQATWNRIINSGEQLSNYDRDAVMSGFNKSRQGELLASFTEQYFDKVIEIINRCEHEFAKSFCNGLLPAYEKEEIVIEKIEKLLPLIPGERLDIIREYREHISVLQKRKLGKELSISYLNSKKA